MFNRMLGVTFYLFFHLGAGHWLLSLLCAWVGAYQFFHGRHGAAYLLWALAVLTVALALTAQLLDYVWFEPVALSTSLDEQAPPTLVPGLATGTFESNDGSGTVMQGRVQVRWLEREGRAPVLAALTPADLPPDVRAPIIKATLRSIWYPGSEIEAGWIYTRWEKHFGLRLRFLGRQLMVAVDEAGARSIMAAFQRAEAGGK